MSGYAGSGSAKLIRENQQVFLFQQEINVTGRASIAVQLERIPRASYPWGVSLQIYFTDANGSAAAPGAFEIDVQTSDIDLDNQYCLEGTAVSAVNTNNVARVGLTAFWAKFLRVYVKTLTNAVYVTVLVTR